MTGRYWKTYAVAAFVMIAAYQAVPSGPGWEAAWQIGVGCLGVGALVVGARRLPRPDRLPWYCFAVGVGANVAGIPVSIVWEQVLHQGGLPTPADPLFLLLYPACAAGLGLLIRRREPYRNWTAMVDATTITTGLGLFAWIYVIQVAAGGEDISMLGRAVQAAYPIGDLLLLAMMTRLLRGGGRRGAAFWWMTGSLGAFLIGDSTWVVIGNLGEVGAAIEDLQWAGRAIGQIFLVAFVLFGVAALHPQARDVSTPVGVQPAGLSRLHLVMLTVASLIAPVLLAVQVVAGNVRDGMAIALGSATLFLLVVVRMAQLLREVERQAGQLRDLARRDELTGLPNRRAWNDELPRALELARRDASGVCVAILDLDRFKAFNDSYGHPAGDRLLASAATAWAAAMRGHDVLARWGGEEFIVLLPGADVDQARAVVGRALAATPLGQTFSAGVAVWDGAETSDVLITRADEALYEAKAAGRNRIEVSAPSNDDRPSSGGGPRSGGDRLESGVASEGGDRLQAGAASESSDAANRPAAAAARK